MDDTAISTCQLTERDTSICAWEKIEVVWWWANDFSCEVATNIAAVRWIERWSSETDAVPMDDPHVAYALPPQTEGG
jgi:hypothetical protein